MCRNHRFGAGQWFRCYECPSEALREAREAWEAQEAEERAQARAGEALEASRLAELGPPHLSPPGTFRAGVWWGLARMELLREVARASFGEPPGERAKAPPAQPSTRRRRSQGRPPPYHRVRRWRREIARRRGYGAAMPARRPRQQRPAPALRWGRVVRGAAVSAVALVLAVVPLHPALAPTPTPAVVPELAAVPVDVHAGAAPPAPGAPPKPVRGQKRAPCIEGLELNLGGYCWLPVEAHPPNCPRQTLPYGGKCLLPMAPQQGPPVSLDAGTPG